LTLPKPDFGPSRPLRLAYVLSHPIQYQAPMIRRIAAEPDIDITVFYQSDFSVRGFFDPGFGREIAWDVPLLDGYKSEFLPALGRRAPSPYLYPLNYGIGGRLRTGQFDALWVHGYARWFNWVAMLAARRQGLAVLLRDEATLISAPRSPAKQRAKQLFMAVLRACVDGILAIGSRNRDYYLAHGFAAERIFPMPYCVDNDAFAASAATDTAATDTLRHDLRLEPGRPVILFVSKLQARKHPEHLLAAYRRLSGPKPYLLFAGDGAARPALEIEASDDPDIRFLGFQGQSALGPLLALADVFVLPSVHEPWGLVVNEAMSAGCALVLSDQVGAAADLVHAGINGLTYPAGDIGALASALTQILGTPGLSRRMGAESRRLIAGWSFEQDVAGLRLALAATVPGFPT